MNNSGANTSKLVADVIKNGNNSHLAKQDLGKVKTGLAKGREATKFRETWSLEASAIKGANETGVWEEAAVAGPCKLSAASLTRRKQTEEKKESPNVGKRVGKKCKPIFFPRGRQTLAQHSFALLSFGGHEEWFFFPYAESQMKQMKLTGSNFPTKTAVFLESLQLLSLRGYKN